MSLLEKKIKNLCFINLPSQKGGPGTFLVNFQKKLKEKKIKFFYYKNIKNNQIIFVVSGTIRKFFWLIYQKICGAQIIQRVDGHLWQYRYLDLGFKNILYSKIVNFNVKFIMRFLADKIIFQSLYVKNLWKDTSLNKKKKYIIYNFCQNFKKRKIKINSQLKLVCVEGNFDAVFNFLPNLKLIKKYPIYLYGDCSLETKKILRKIQNVKYIGTKNRNQILQIYNTNKKIIFLSLEFYAAGSNSVIEAMSNSVPVIGFKTGCMSEFVNKNSGILINYNIKKFKDNNYLNNLNIDEKIKKIEKKYNYYSNGAYSTAKKKFNADKNASSYLNVIYGKKI